MSLAIKCFWKVTFLSVKYWFRHEKNCIPILKSLLFFNKKVRVSVSAILYLEQENKYVLIKNHHRPSFYAPIGGVYKHFEPKILDEIEWNSDYTTLENKESDMKKDLRGVIYGKRLPDFIDWFSKREGRENEQCIYRELREELLEGKVGKILREQSSKIEFEIFRSIPEGPRSISDRDYDAQFRFFDIYKIVNSNEDTNQVLQEIVDRASRGDNNLILVSKEDILSGKIPCGEKLIAGHAKYYFTSKWHGQEPARY